MNAIESFVIPDQVLLWATNVLIHATVLTAISLLIALLFRKAAATRYWILCLGMLLVLGSPLISALIQSRGNSLLTLALPVEDIPTAPPSPLPIVNLTPEFERPIGYEPTAEAEAALIPETMTMALDAASAPSVVVVETIENVRSTSDWLRFIVSGLIAVWAIGTMILLLRMSIGWARMAQILKQAGPVESVELQQAFGRACVAVGCGRAGGPRFVVSDAVSGPIAAGILGGSVVLPRRVIEQVDVSNLANVLVHEVAHVARRDQIVVLVQNLVAALYWPHPLVKILNCELAKAREEVCDNFVLAATEAPNYSRTLLSLAELVQRPDSMPGSVGFFTSRWRVEQRVAGLLDETRDRATFLSRRRWIFVAATSALLATLMCIGTITIATAQNKVNEDVIKVDPLGLSSTVSGMVTGPDRNPISGARLIAVRHYRANISWNSSSEIVAETASDSNGNYAIQIPESSSEFSDGKHLQTQHTAIMATHAGFGPDEQVVAPSRSTTNLRLAKSNIPIVGRVLDLEGLPIAGVRVRLQSIQKPNEDFDKAGVVEKWAQQAKLNPQVLKEEIMADPFSASPESNPVRQYPAGARIDGISCLGIEATTDNEGRFHFDEIGDDRLAMLRLDGSEIASLIVPCVARVMQPVNTPQMDPRYRTGKTFGNQFDIAAEPTQIVRGTVRDRTSKQPLSGVAVGAYQVESLFAIDGFLSATTDSDGKFKLTGLPRHGSQSKRPVVLSVEPFSEQPYFRSTHDVPSKDSLDPIDFDIELTEGVWTKGQATDAKTGQPVPSMIGYHPLIDNVHAQDHEAFDSDITSMGYDEMFATDQSGNFRIPALRGKGVLRVVAANSYDYKIVPVPGTTIQENGTTRPGKREIYHVIMPGNAVIGIDIAEEANEKLVNVKLERAPSHTLRVLDSSGQEASGFYVAGRVDSRRMTLTGSGATFWQDEVSATSLVDIILGERAERDQPLILFDPARDLIAVLWPSEIAQNQASPQQVRLQPCAKIIGQLVTTDGKPLANGIVSAEISDSVDSGERKTFPLKGAQPTDSQGRFEISVPPGKQVSARCYLEETATKLLDIENLESSETIDLGTIDVKADPKNWPEPKRKTSVSVSGRVLDTSGDIVPVQ